jgi:hypothetical protein
LGGQASRLKAHRGPDRPHGDRFHENAWDDQDELARAEGLLSRRFGTCLEDYFIDHGRLPTGVVEIETAREYDRPDERPGPLLVDCDAMTYTVARVLAEFPPPAAYRLSRLQRFNAFFGQILSLARLYEKTESASPEVTVAKKRDLLFEFLLSFTVHYERLPQGTLRFDRPHAPFAHFPQLGEIDFDELRRQAGIP